MPVFFRNCPIITFILKNDVITKWRNNIYLMTLKQKWRDMILKNSIKFSSPWIKYFSPLVLFTIKKLYPSQKHILKITHKAKTRVFKGPVFSSETRVFKNSVLFKKTVLFIKTRVLRAQKYLLVSTKTRVLCLKVFFKFVLHLFSTRCLWKTTENIFKGG